MTPPLTAVAEAHRRLGAALAGLTDDAVREPSLLPGWTRGHVLAHLADAARARTRVVEHALRGETVAMWAPGERDSIIDATSGRTADEHRVAVATQAGALERVWSRVEDWPACEPAVYTRWREVWIHLVDLDAGIGPADWPEDFAAHAVGFLRERIPAGTSLTATAGPVRDLAAWLAGRGDGASLTGPLPPLGPWPTY
ncbi:maleylpyruvate isomerase family mycothiol-dependent enzyme [Amycolatopsis saalfeldensis]|uniref:Maleylpyruvate isomerase n=1 Tax=Amycolatopsis saalfeldensis TaxID=394193 RepID=A0A1H8YM41_9PSEU|nr:maleylpyruvate isomerase family mycothiol-dependent enzyme [Amycolatopsis saalfeldensis]SEP53219.1 maleylpyruvate isomerase [Amycolatopsis saalfeldensis]